MDFVELFCGIGGFRLGLERNGWKCVWANDFDKYACKVYRKQFGDKELVEADIRTIDPNTIPNHDLLTGGFPCQSFSVAGQHKGFNDVRGTMFFEIARIIEVKRPKLLLLENVKGLLSAQNGYCFYRIVEILDELGYDVEWQVLNSKYFGVPQNRERVFIIGHLREGNTRQIFPIGKAFKGTLESRGTTQGERTRFRSNCASVDSRTGSTARGQHFIANSLNVGGSGRENLITGTISHRYGKDGKENLIRVGEIWEGSQCRVYDSEGIAPTIHKSGGSTEPMIVQPCLTPDRTNKRQYGRRFKENGEPAFTLTGQDVHGVMITETNVKRTPLKYLNRNQRNIDGDYAFTVDGANTGGIMISNTLDADGYLRTGVRPRDENGKPQLLPIGYRRIRRLTPVECERLQGFPDSWTEGVSDTQRYKLLGNAVTVNVIKFLGEHLNIP